jgi:putative redox protein
VGQVNVKWVEDKQFIGTDSTNHSVVISSPADGIGMKPSDLLMVSLASCTAYDVVNILQKRRKQITDLHIQVEGEQAPDPPWAFQKIHIHYVVGGIGLSDAEVEKAIKLSKDKYCSVSATLAQAVDLTFDFEVVERNLAP